MEVAAPILAIALLVVLAADTVACAIPIQYIKDDLARLNVSAQTCRIIPFVKAAAVAGLLIGLWVPALGVAACVGLLGYFACAIGVHRRENDEFAQYIPAIGFAAFIAAALIFSYIPGL